MTKDFISRVEIEDLFADYNAALDDREIERWPSFFTDVCSYLVTTRENVDRNWQIALLNCETRGMMIDRIAALQNTMYFLPRQQRRIMSGIRIAGAERELTRVQASFAVFESLPSETTKILATGRSFDVLRYENEQLKFVSRRCVLDAALVPNSLIYPL